MQGQPLIGRFAPSPSGRMHLGNLASALIAYASIRKQGGRFLLRIEDLDTARCKPAFADAIMRDLEWIGITWDNADVWWQRERSALYAEHLARLSARAQVYPCFCTRADLHAASAPHASNGQLLYAGTCSALTAAQIQQRMQQRSPAMRIAVPEQRIDFVDGVYGMQSQQLHKECGDFVLKRSDGLYAYQLAVVVDDALSGVTEVVRGSDLLSSTARQIWLHHTLGYDAPIFTHIPLLCATDGRRLSKRQRDLDMGALRNRVTPQSLLGIIAHWYGLQDAPSACTIAEFTQLFAWPRIHAQAIVLSEERMDMLS